MDIPIPKRLKTIVLAFTFLSLFGSIFAKSVSVNATADVEILKQPMHLTGQNSASESYQSVPQDILNGVSSLQVTYDLHGTCILGGDASAIIFDQSNEWRYVSLANYGKNCQNGQQTVNIKLTDFSGLDQTKPVGNFHSRFWFGNNYNIDIVSVKTLGTTGTSGSTMAPSQNTGSFKAEFWNGSDSQIPQRTPDLTRNDSDVNFDWSSGSPDSRIVNDHFLARWTKTQQFAGGSYRFISQSDDGIRVWLDNDLLIDQWTDHALKTDGADRTISAGNHQLKVEYYENTGNSVVKLNISQLNSSTPSSPIPTSAPQVNQPNGQTWTIQSVSSMKETKDKICGQDDQAYIEKWVDKAKELGANYVAVETPYDNPSCGNSVEYTKKWIDVIRSRGLKVWHRHMFTAFEGIYGAQKTRDDYLSKTAQYIKDHPNFFKAGDIFTPQPEPQNGGIQGFTGCDQGVCQYASIADFNKWLRDAIDVSNQAFSQIGLGGQMKVGYYGFDGFVTWGSNNPDWHGILEDATVQKMGNITIDHYPELIGQTMEQGLNELQAKYPNTPIVIGEWGSAGSGDVQNQVNNSMGAAKRPNIIGFNYWHLGMGGNEALINSDFTNRPQFKDVQDFYLGKR
jgi:hypothetical protein